jgi:hypothetical protein
VAESQTAVLRLAGEGERKRNEQQKDLAEADDHCIPPLSRDRLGLS